MSVIATKAELFALAAAQPVMRVNGAAQESENRHRNVETCACPTGESAFIIASHAVRTNQKSPRQKSNFANSFKLIWVVQSSREK
jgi:hypothetical protein